MSWRFRIALAIVLGATTTVLLAWSIAIFQVEEKLGLSAPLGSGVTILEKHKDGSGWVASAGIERSPLGSAAEVGFQEVPLDQVRWWGSVTSPYNITDYVDADVLAAVPHVPFHHLEVHRVGWPRPVFEWREQVSYVPPTPGASIPTAAPPIREGVFTLPVSLTPPGSSGIVPTILRWRGLLYDTAIFSLIWLSLLLLPRIGRTIDWWVRRRCAICGYDRRGIPSTAPCPECGNTALQRATPG
jgi:hypothetical protein